MQLNYFCCTAYHATNTKMIAQQLAKNYFDAINYDLNDPKQTNFTIHLQGQLGTGKTTFVRAFLKALHIKDHIKSPTYTLLEAYQITTKNGELDIYHFDLYRMHNELEWVDAGFDEYFAHPALRLIEWPDRAKQILPQPDCLVKITAIDKVRKIDITGFSRLSDHCLTKLKNKIYV